MKALKLTRRQLAALVSATTVSQAQTAPTPGDLQAARERLKANAESLAKLDVPASTEPAFQFKA